MCSSDLARVPALPGLLSLMFCLLALSARAELVWSAQTGWRVEGGMLSGLTGAEGRNALDQMNKARSAEEGGSLRSAVKTYQSIAKKWPNSVYAPESLYRSAKLQLRRQEYTKSFEDFQQVLSKYPNTKRFNEIVGEQYRIDRKSTRLNSSH